VYSFRLEDDELILKKAMANLYVEREAYNGALYLTTGRLVFVGYMMDIRRKYVADISLVHIKEIKPGKTFFVIPNVIQITTINGGTLKFIVDRRDEWVAAISRQIDSVE